MTISQLLGLAGGVAVFGFIVFAFRQGMQVKPDERENQSSIRPSDFNPPH
jgi:hypothetical protein